MKKRNVKNLLSGIWPINLPAAEEVRLGDRFNQKRDWHRARDHYRAAVQKDPSQAHIWVQLGHAEKELGRTSHAIDAYKQATVADPRHSDAFFQLAHSLRHIGNKVDGFTNFLKAVEIDGHPEAAKEISHMMGSKKPHHEVLTKISTVFSAKDYLRFNPDVGAAGVDPLTHYLLFGWRERRVASVYFDAHFYEHRYKRFLDADTLPLLHYAENRENGFRGNIVAETLWFEPVAPLSQDWDTVAEARLGASTRSVVILPVYKGYDETLSAVYHALSARHGENYSLLVINDCGPDEKLNNALQKLADNGLFDYHFNKTNRGFVQTCNFAINELSANLDVVLLNSDAFVFPGWFGRLVKHADLDPSVATVTPLSNNATICSYPLTDRDNCLALEHTPAAIDALAASANKGVSIETPTGVGFCFFMRRSVIEEIGALDEKKFIVGYGEENDFCMRSLNSGYKNLIACDVYVFHVGSVSFSSIKQTNFDAGQKNLAEKHPNYSTLVRQHVAADPSLYPRRRLDLARLAASACGGVLLVSHRWEGGIDTYLEGKRAEFGTMILGMRVHDQHFVSFAFEEGGIFIPNLANIDIRTDGDLIAEILAIFSPTLIHVNSFAGLNWVSHEFLLTILRKTNAQRRYIVHDYSAISDHYQLIRPDGLYVGLPTQTDLKAWARMRQSPATDTCDPDIRRKAYADFFADSEIEAPSQTAKDILDRYYSNLQINVVPHEADYAMITAHAAHKKRDYLRIAFLGAIGPHKGSDLLLALAKDAQTRNLPIRYSIAGYSDQDAQLRENGVYISGKYRSDKDALALLETLDPDFLFIGSIWPETYCYTLSLAFRSGIPPIVFDLGAQAERVKRTGFGTILPLLLANDPKELSNVLLGLANQK